MGLAVSLARASDAHLFLCPTMLATFSQQYAVKCLTAVVSNVAFLAGAETRRSAAAKLGLIGYISNISREKGIDCYLDILEEMHTQGSDIRGVIAGPFATASAEEYVRERIKRLPNVMYVGPLYGRSKQDFFSNIDLLLFPSRYQNEAQPLVMLEALLAGVPAIATSRACLTDLLVPSARGILDYDASSIEQAVTILLRWSEDDKSFRGIAEEAVRQAQECQALALDELRSFQALVAERRS